MRPSYEIEAHLAALRGRRDELISQRDAVPRREDPERQADRQARVEELGREIVALQGIGITTRTWEEDQARALERAPRRLQLLEQIRRELEELRIARIRSREVTG